MNDVSRPHLVEQLRGLGISPGVALVVHTSFRRIGPVEGGPSGLIYALMEAVGAAGTLVMPSMADHDDEPFDVARTSCRASMGVVAETFWRLPGVLRSDSPHAFAAWGPRASAVTAPHPVDIPHGRDSPVGRVDDMDGWILLLGVGHDANTTMHLAENEAKVRYRLPSSACVYVDGAGKRIDYGEVDHCCQGFALMDGWLEAEGCQRRGKVGNGEARLCRAHDVVRLAKAALARDETVFLHPMGACAECDEARRSIPSG